MGAEIAAIGAIASLAQTGYGIYQKSQTQKAMDKALAEAKAQPKPENAFANMRLADEAYAAQDQQAAQTEANLVNALSENGTSAVIGGIPVVQQQMNALNANITSQKARDLSNIELQKANAQQGIDNNYAEWQKQLNLMELQGAGAANSQANQMMWQGIGGLANVAGAYAMGMNKKANPSGNNGYNGSYLQGNAIEYPQQTTYSQFGQLPFMYSNPQIPE